jgi:hypothetical protein
LSGFFDGMSTPAQQPAGQVIVEPAQVSVRLSELHDSLEEALFREANEHGYRARLDVTPAHPTTAAGTFHWHAAVFALRTALLEREWIKKDPQNCPFIVSPDKSIAILVMTGDADTGVIHGYPTNQTQKGAVLKQAISANYELFETAMISKLERTKNGTQMWVLLYHVGVDTHGHTELRAELSLPSRFDRKKIVEWTERIILGAIHPDGEYDTRIDAPVAPAPVDVPVERRHAS